MKRTIFIISVVILAIFSSCRKDDNTQQPPPSEYKLTDFESSQSCSTCHPQYYEEWKGSMHRYATNDPIWMLAANSLQQSTNGKLKDWCFQCHSPIAFLTKTSPKMIDISKLPEIVREGVNCDVCHTLLPPHKTTDQNIFYNIKPGKTKYSTLKNPVPAGAHENGYDASQDRSESCRQCHDLIVNGIPLEMTFTEWQNSQWAMSAEFDCQDCHMKTYTGRAATGGPIRENLHRHDFIGVDVAITDFPNKPQQRAAIDSLLKNAATLTANIPSSANLNDSINIGVTIINDKTGHNLPTSVFFNRQMWIEVTVSKGSDTVYRSGHFDANGDLMDNNSAIAPNADKDLVIFNGSLYKDGHPSNAFELDSVVNKTIPPFAWHTANYKFKVLSSGIWNVKTRLLFRPFGPYLFRSLGASQYVSELPVFEMNSYETNINVQ
ncbi:MAG: hypothetical protein FJ218_00060 [Ignavibacteria bacterium]|nr:hypothetical protein [Ignavibacteria bacterium]